MINIENSSAVSISIYGESKLSSLLIRLCGGYWLFDKRPSELRRFVNEMPIANLTVNVKGTPMRVLIDKRFQPDTYDRVTRYIRTLPLEDETFSSGRVSVKIKNDSMDVSWGAEQNAYN